MINFENSLIPKISQRCYELRIHTSFAQGDVSDKASVIRIEKGENIKTRNFISDKVLTDYSIAFNVSKEEIIFGNNDDFEELLHDWFSIIFQLILLRNLDDDISCYEGEGYEELDKKVQKSVIKLASIFAEYDMQRYKFLQTKEKYMDSIYKLLMDTYFHNNNSIDAKEFCQNMPPRLETDVNFFKIKESLWLICKNDIITSFKDNVINKPNDKLFKNFKFSSINDRIQDWISNSFINRIVPDTIEQLKKNSVFNIGFLTNTLITEYLKKDFIESFQETVPLQTKREKHYEIFFDDISLLPDSMREERIKLTKEILFNIKEADIKKLSYKEIRKYNRYGIVIREIPEKKVTRKVGIDSILNQAIKNSTEKNIDPTKPRVEVGPIIKISDFKSEEERREYFDFCYDMSHFSNLNIPGYFGKNSEILDSLQKDLNKDIIDLINKLIQLQNAMLKLLTHEDLITIKPSHANVTN